MKKAVKDIIIVAIGVVIIWIAIQVAFGTTNPFYVVVSGSMVPELQVYDVLIVQGHASFQDVKIGDIIVFDRPSDHQRVIVHRVVSVIDDDPRTLRTKGDANTASIPGTDYPITVKEYIGTVTYVVPQVGYITQALKPPVNYIIIVIVVGVMIAKQLLKKKDDALGGPDSDHTRNESPPDVGADVGADSEYSRHTKQNVQNAKNIPDVDSKTTHRTKSENSKKHSKIETDDSDR